MKQKTNQRQWEKEFKSRTDKHIHLVKIACLQLNKIPSIDTKISRNEIDTHDLSKYSKFEFPHYARYICGDKNNKKEWEKALMHHYSNNAHHPQYYLKNFNAPYTEANCIPKEMPMEQCMVFVADKFAASKQYTSFWDFSISHNGKMDWLNENLGGNKPKIIIHSKTHEKIDFILSKIGYWTNCDNSPQYCLISLDFIEKLEAHINIAHYIDIHKSDLL